MVRDVTAVFFYILTNAICKINFLQRCTLTQVRVPSGVLGGGCKQVGIWKLQGVTWDWNYLSGVVQWFHVNCAFHVFSVFIKLVHLVQVDCCSVRPPHVPFHSRCKVIVPSLIIFGLASNISKNTQKQKSTIRFSLSPSHASLESQHYGKGDMNGSWSKVYSVLMGRMSYWDNRSSVESANFIENLWLELCSDLKSGPSTYPRTTCKQNKKSCLGPIHCLQKEINKCL